MKAVVFHAIGDIRLDTVPDPKREAPTGAIDAYEACDGRADGRLDVEFAPGT